MRAGKVQSLVILHSSSIRSTRPPSTQVAGCCVRTFLPQAGWMDLGSNGKPAALFLREAFRMGLGSNGNSAALFLRRGLHGAQTLTVGVKEA